MPGLDQPRVQIGAARHQRLFQRRGHAVERVAKPREHQHPCAGKIGGGRVFQRLHRAQQDGAADHTGVKLHDRAQQVRAIGIAEETDPVRIQPVTPDRARHESCESLGFRCNVGLIVGHRVEAAEPAVDALLGRAAAQAQKRGARVQFRGQRHQVGLVAAGAVQQHDHAAVGVVRRMKAVDEGQVAHRHPFLARSGELRQHEFQIGGTRGIAGRDHQGLAQMLRRLVDGEAGGVGGIFEQGSGGLADIKRQEILAVMNVGGAVHILQRQSHPAHGIDIRRPEGDVIEDRGAGDARKIAARIADIDRIPVRNHAAAVALGPVGAIAEAGGECRRRLGVVGQDGDAADAGGGRRVGQWRGRGQVDADQLDDDPVGILQAQHGFAEFPRRAFDRDMRGHGALQPVANALWRDGKGDLGDLTQPGAAGCAGLPDQEGDDTAGAAGGIAIEQVQLLGILVTAGLLDQPETQEADIEIDIVLHPPGDGGDVMDAGGHFPASRASTRCTAGSAASRSCSACTCG